MMKLAPPAEKVSSPLFVPRSSMTCPEAELDFPDKTK
jgi:hypothetical protein